MIFVSKSLQLKYKVTVNEVISNKVKTEKLREMTEKLREVRMKYWLAWWGI